ncbi:MAG: radical SAM family heme chaperone HemW [Bacteroidales bacterium]|nr:radical SAM family heme chaperone HemW [Bacteroidales bacterium]
MAGLYIHIPFCLSRCHFCDFFSTTKLELIDYIIHQECLELEERKHEVNEIIETIYIGGGTPSLLNQSHLMQIFSTIQKHYRIKSDAEITLEANPDDVCKEKVRLWKQFKINRISLGVQSFDDKVLTFLNRRHNQKKALEAIEQLCNNDIYNISIDLIYGIPNMPTECWEKTLQTATQLPIKHISSYHLTIENKTYFGLLKRKKLLNELSDDDSLRQYQLLRSVLLTANFKHYEISNFCLPGWHSQHNTAYWFNKSYIGIGPSAHSYNGNTRRWNISNIQTYLQQQNKPYFKIEHINSKQRFNEYLLTRLRTAEGGNLEELKQIHQHFFEKWHCQFLKLVDKKLIITTKTNFYIPAEHWLISDYIIRELWV